MNTQELNTVLQRFHHVNLAIQITPLQKLNNIETLLDYPDIYMKRDDLNGLGAGGNKVRNLEYLLGDAIANDFDTIIASGTNESNLCMLTAAACRKLGLDCVLVHNDNQPTINKGNMLLNSILDVKHIFLGEVDEIARNLYVEKVKKDLEINGKKPYVIYNGATTPMGSLGYVAGALELLNQINEKNINIANVFVPGGNGGLAAGMIFGAGALDLPFHVNVITVEHKKSKLYDIVFKLVKGIEELTEVKLEYKLEDIMTIYGEYRGQGWNRSTVESNNMIYKLAKLEGIFLDKTYTSKTFLGMTDLLKKGHLKKGGACFLHSGGFSALFDQF